jgi:anti-repressor protein
MKIVSGELKQTVNARDLHEFLEVGKDFSNWIKDRIEQFNFEENQDFIIFAESGEKGRPRQDYYLTLDMAKELSMVERNDRGKQARQYFIACEKNLREIKSTISIPKTLPEALRLAATLAEEVDKTNKQLAIAAPKVEFYDTVTA